MSDGSPQCFKFFPEKKGDWYIANATCEAEGLMMALPTDAVAVALRKDLFYTYGKPHLLYLIYENKIYQCFLNDKTQFVFVFMIVHVSVCMFTFMNMYEHVSIHH